MKNALFFFCLLATTTQVLAQPPSVSEIAARNKATFIKVNAAYNEKRLDEAAQYYAANFERKSEKVGPGRAGVKARWEDTYKTWPDNKAIIEQIIAEGDLVMIKCKATATHTNVVMGVQPTNKKIEADYWETIRFDKEGLIVESYSTLDNYAMMKQLGLLNKPTPSVMNEDEAIKQVIIDQTIAWANRDTTAYYACYANNDLMQSNYNNRDLSIGIYLGYAELQKYVRNGMKANPNKVYQPAVERTNWVIKLLSPEWAWVNFSQKTTTVRGIINTSYETRLMHKEDGKWRITVVNALWDYKNVVYPMPNPEEEDIKNVIINETEMWLDQNKVAWAENFIHEPHIMWSVTNGGEPGDVLTMRGWDALDTYMTAWFSNDMSALTKQWRKAKTTRDQWQIQIRSNVAYVSFNQRGDGEKQKMDSTETRVLEKINGKWKIAMSTTLVDFKDATPPIKSKY
jgi:predicted ester cyclase